MIKKLFKTIYLFDKIFIVFLIVITVFSLGRLVWATTPNPGHTWSETGDGTFSVSGPTLMRTYTFPDNNATILTNFSTITIGQGGTGASDKTNAFNNLSPLTTKGDFVVFDGTNNVRFPAPTPIGDYDGQILIVDSTAPFGVRWGDLSISGSETDPVISAKLTAKGDLISSDGSVLTTLTVGDNGKILIADNTSVSGLRWGDVTPAGTEIDPIFIASAANGIAGTDITNWNNAFGWGNHADAGYLTTETDSVITGIFSTTGDLLVRNNVGALVRLPVGSTDGQVLSVDNSTATGLNWVTVAGAGAEIDPIFIASAANGIAGTDITNWNNAFGWGNHADAGYLTSYTETDSVVKSITGIIKSNGTTISAATAGTDYLVSETDPLAVLKATYTTNGDLLYGTGAGTYTRLGIGSAGQVLTLTGGVPVWATPTSGILSLNGLTGATQTFEVGTTGNAPAFSSATTIHTLNIPMASTASVTAGLISKTDYDIFNTKITNPMTTLGDIIYGGASGVPTRLAGATGILHSTGSTAPTWGAVNLASADVTGTLSVANGGSATRANYVDAYDTTVQTVSGANTWTTVTFNNVPQLNGWTYSAGAFTVPATGLYILQFNAFMEKTSGGGANNGEVRITKNNIVIPGTEEGIVFASNNNICTFTRQATLSLVAGDVLRFQFVGETVYFQLNYYKTNTTAPISSSISLVRIN